MREIHDGRDTNDAKPAELRFCAQGDNASASLRSIFCECGVLECFAKLVSGSNKLDKPPSEEA
jgi:hypothetical protein